MKYKRALGFGLSSLILLVLIYLADTELLIESVKKADEYLVLGILVGILVVVIWAKIWQLFLEEIDKRLRYFYTLRIFSAGLFLNLVTPLGQFGGQPAIAYVVSKDLGIEYEKSLSMIFSADMINILPQHTFFFAALGYSFLFQTRLLEFRYINEIIAASFSVFIIGLLIILYIDIIKDTAFLSLDKLSMLGTSIDIDTDQLDERFDNFKQTLSAIGNNYTKLAITLILSHIAMLGQAAILYLMVSGIGIPITPIQILYILPIAGLANWTPTPGGSGTFEGLLTLLLVFFTGTSFSTALTATLLFRVCTYWQWIILGYTSLISLNITRDTLRRYRSKTNELAAKNLQR